NGYLAARVAKDDCAAAFYLHLVPPAERKALEARADVDALAPMSALAARHLGQGGNSSQALPLLEEILKVKKDKLGPQDPATLDAEEQLGKAYWRVRQFDKAIPVFEELLKIQEGKLGRKHLETQRTVSNLGISLKAVGQIKRAIPLFEEAQQTAKQEPELAFV